ncbi:hypothetical protein L2E82_11985 [Cichorium intybus]|uniref:Uncharacterized protein n=1 Tax=Cichorium intybus TaxID=13427 RepID=A0ACB9GEQ8_CICIN|nr:hypothetical protein L2E82_11985 [Cichorium intybus]
MAKGRRLFLCSRRSSTIQRISQVDANSQSLRRPAPLEYRTTARAGQQSNAHSPSSQRPVQHSISAIDFIRQLISVQEIETKLPTWQLPDQDVSMD